MATASYVPITKGRDGESAKEAFERTTVWELLKDSFLRFRYADGFSFSRSLAFQIVLALIPGLIFVVALATAVGQGRLQSILQEAITTLAPGPAGQTLLLAFEQGSDASNGGDTLAMLVGGAAALISGSAAMSQLQRGASRIYGILEDRSTVKRYVRATILALTVGILLAIAFVVIALGSSFGGAFQDDVARTWAWARWPLGLVTLALGLATVFKYAPYRDQPSFAWLSVGGGIAALGWVIVSTGLAMYLNASTTFGETYGPLAGFIGLMLWAVSSGISILYGIAVAAQLEARRAGVESPTEEPTNAKAAS